MRAVGDGTVEQICSLEAKKLKIKNKDRSTTMTTLPPGVQTQIILTTISLIKEKQEE